MKVYEPLNEKDAQTGLFYKEWEVPEGMPVANGLILNGPPKDLKFPRYYPEKGVWVEDKDSYITEVTREVSALKASNAEVMTRIEMSDATILELADIVLGGMS